MSEASLREQWPFWRRYVNLAQPRLGAQVIHVTDDFFGAAERLLRPEEPVFIEGKYDDHGKWMDGWESRRRRDQDHDHCTITLGAPSRLSGVDIDTRHFNGNQPDSASLEGALCAAGETPEANDWFEVLGAVPLGADQQHRHEITEPRPLTHLRLHIFPDGGVARLRAYGVVEGHFGPKDSRCQIAKAEQHVDLAAVGNGGCVVAASDEHFGIASNLLLPDRGLHMGDGWETARRRGPGHDWVIVALGCPGRIHRLVVDTAHFKGNYPDRCLIEAGLASDGGQPATWTTLVPETKLNADSEHSFASDSSIGEAVFSHVRLSMFPDGGVSRLRVFGVPERKPDDG